MAAQCGCVGRQVYRKDQETGAGCKQRALGEEEKISEIQRKDEKMKKIQRELGTGI